MANLILWTTYNDKTTLIRTAGAYQLASWLRMHGYSVKVIDFCYALTTQELVDITQKHIDKDTIAVGISSTFWDIKVPNSDNSSRFAEPEWVSNSRTIIESKNPSLYWLLGGPNVHASPKKFNWVEIPGYAEDALLKWMDQNSNKYVRRNSFDIKTSIKVHSADDFIQPAEPLSLELGRGCVFRCKFCTSGLLGKKPGTYLREYDLIREELITNYNEFGTTKYYYQDDTVNEDIDKVRALANIAQSLPFELEWVGYNRLDLIGAYPESIQYLKDSGLKSAYFGIESFHPKASMSVGKGWNGKNGKDFLLKLKEEWNSSVTWSLSFIVGLPGETEDSLNDTYKWCVDNEMYDWLFLRLYLNKAHTSSEFSNNYSKYGYRYPTDNTMFWENDNWNYQTATDFANALNSKSMQYRKISSWSLFRYSSIDLMSTEELMKTRYIDLPLDKIETLNLKFLKNYVQQNLL